MRALEQRMVFGNRNLDPEKDLRLHRERLKNVRKCIDNNPPVGKDIRQCSPQKRHIERRAEKEHIYRENVLLTKRICDIYDKESHLMAHINDTRHLDAHPGTMNYKQRLVEAQRIHHTNMMMAERLQDVQPHYKAGDLCVYRPSTAMTHGSPNGKSRTQREQQKSRDAKQKKTRFMRELELTLRQRQEQGEGPAAYGGPNSSTQDAMLFEDYYLFTQSARASGGESNDPLGDSTMPRFAPYFGNQSYGYEQPEQRQQQQQQQEEPYSPYVNKNNNHSGDVVGGGAAGGASGRSKILLEYTKAQDGHILDIVVLKEPFRDVYAIFGKDMESGDRYELRLTSNDVSTILDGDMLVTSVDNVEVWLALLPKVRLSAVDVFSKLPFTRDEVQFVSREGGRREESEEVLAQSWEPQQEPSAAMAAEGEAVAQTQARAPSAPNSQYRPSRSRGGGSSSNRRMVNNTDVEKEVEPVDHSIEDTVPAEKEKDKEDYQRKERQREEEEAREAQRQAAQAIVDDAERRALISAELQRKIRAAEESEREQRRKDAERARPRTREAVAGEGQSAGRATTPTNRRVGSASAGKRPVSQGHKETVEAKATTAAAVPMKPSAPSAASTNPLTSPRKSMATTAIRSNNAPAPESHSTVATIDKTHAAKTADVTSSTASDQSSAETTTDRPVARVAAERPRSAAAMAVPTASTNSTAETEPAVTRMSAERPRSAAATAVPTASASSTADTEKDVTLVETSKHSATQSTPSPKNENTPLVKEENIKKTTEDEKAMQHAVVHAMAQVTIDSDMNAATAVAESVIHVAKQNVDQDVHIAESHVLQQQNDEQMSVPVTEAVETPIEASRKADSADLAAAVKSLSQSVVNFAITGATAAVQQLRSRK